MPPGPEMFGSPQVVGQSLVSVVAPSSLERVGHDLKPSSNLLAPLTLRFVLSSMTLSTPAPNSHCLKTSVLLQFSASLSEGIDDAIPSGVDRAQSTTVAGMPRWVHR